jgi:hypothetical protein
MTTLYYKGSGKVPWRRLPEEGEFTACYIGISFFKDAETDEIWTSAAQMFDERGRGFILRGGPAQSEARGRHPFLTADESHRLTVPSRMITLTLAVGPFLLQDGF